MNTRRLLYTLLGLGLFTLGRTCPAYAGFELERPGARPAGMGGAFVAVADDADAMLYNPAGLGQILSSALAFNYASLLTGLDDGVLADSRLTFLQPNGEWGTFGLSWDQRNLTDVYQENLVSLGYGLSVDDEGSYLVGLVLKLFHQNYLDSASIRQNPYFDKGSAAIGFSLDIGGLVYLTDDLTAGLSIANLNQPSVALGSADSIVPLRLRAGTAYQMENYLGSLELLMTPHGYRVSLGGEAWWFDGVLGTRLGTGVSDRDLAEITVGFSGRFDQTTWQAGLDYAFIAPLGGFAGAGLTHQINLVFSFGAGDEDMEVVLARNMVEQGEIMRQQGDFESALVIWDEAAEVLTEDEELEERIADLQEEMDTNAEIKLYLEQALKYEKDEDFLNAADRYRQVLVLDLKNSRAVSLLKQVKVKIRELSEQQKLEQERTAVQAAAQARQQAKKQSWEDLREARRSLARARKNPRITRNVPDGLKALSQKMAEAERRYKQGENERVQVIAQAVVRDARRLAQRATRIETDKAEVKSKAPAAPAAVTPVVKAAPTVQAPKPAAAPQDSRSLRMRKRARGAYGRAVKLMLDIDKLNGMKYFPSQVKKYKKELAQIKTLLRSEDYATTIQYARQLYPKLKKLKERSAEKDKARRAMPTNW